MSSKKAKFVGKIFVDGVPYGMYEYRGETYEVCFNSFYTYKTLAEEHRDNQRIIDRQLELRNQPRLIPTEKWEVGFEKFWEGVNA